MASPMEAPDLDIRPVKNKKKSKKGMRSHALPVPPPPPAEQDAWKPEAPVRKVLHDDDDMPYGPEVTTEYDLSAKDPEPPRSCDILAPTSQEEPISEEPDGYEAAVAAIPGTSDWDLVVAGESSVDETPTEGRSWPEEESAAAEPAPAEAYEEPGEEAKTVDDAPEEENGEPKPDNGYVREEQKIASLPFSTPYRLMAHLQQILEEACFACGQKNWPELLRKHNWDCVEAVPLAAWVKELEHLQHTLDTQPSRRLLQSIAEVQTIAVERRPISWPMMKKFFDDAVELTEILRVKKFGEIAIQIRRDIGKTMDGLSQQEEEAQSQEEKKLQWITEERRRLCEREAEVRKDKAKCTKEFQKSAESEIKRVLEEAKKTLETTAFFSGLETRGS